jgi:hypothetical protein
MAILLFPDRLKGSKIAAPPGESKSVPSPRKSSALARSKEVSNEKMESLIGANSTTAMYRMIESVFSSEEPNRFLPSLIKICAKEKDEVVQYILAQGDSAPPSMRVTLYAAALDNPSEDIRNIASSELKAIIDQDFQSSKSAFRWIDAHKAELDE